MSKTYTVTEYSGDYNDWGGNDKVGPTRYFTFKFRDSDGGVGTGSFGRLLKDGHANPPEVGFEFVANAQFSEQHQNWKFTKVKTPEQAAQYGGGGSGGGASYGGDKQRSKEQCMRGEAIIAAASLAKSHEEAIRIAGTFYGWIDGSVTAAATSPTPESVTAQAPPVPDEIPF